MVLTVSAVELGEAGRVAAGQLGGAPEGVRSQAGNQRAVARLCWPITKQKGKHTVRNSSLHRSKRINSRASSLRSLGFAEVLICGYHGDVT